MKDFPLTGDEVKILKSMSLYWDEISKRDQPNRLLHDEIRNLCTVLSPLKILSIVSKHVNDEHK